MQGTLNEHMCTEYVILGESEGVAEAQVNVRLRSKMEYRVDVVFTQAFEDIRVLSHIAMEEAEIRSPFEHSRVISRAAIIQFVERHDIICVGVLRYQVSNQPRSTDTVRRGSISQSRRPHMKPSPPVTSMFRTSGRGSNEPLPVSIGASRQRPSSTKNRDSRLADTETISLASKIGGSEAYRSTPSLTNQQPLSFNASKASTHSCDRLAKRLFK